MINTIYVDMDGVLVDFDQYVLDDIGVNPVNFTKLYGRQAFESYMIRNTKNKEMFFNMEPMQDIKAGMKMIEDLILSDYDVKLLSCTSEAFLGQCTGMAIADQKRRWLNKHGFDIYELDYIFTPSHDGKSEYANKQSLLIDDSDWSVNPFREKKGHAIKHYDFENTTSELRSILLDTKGIRHGLNAKTQQEFPAMGVR